MSAAADQDLLQRLEALYGRAFLRRLVAAGEEVRRLATGGEAPPEIVARIRLRRERGGITWVGAWQEI